MNAKRRLFLGMMVAGTGAGLPGVARGMKPIERAGTHLKGLSLSAYSLKDEMAWMKGEKGPGAMEIPDFLDYCAEVGVEAAELTAYFFPEPVTDGFLMEVKRKAYLLGLDLPTGAIGNNFAVVPGSGEAAEQLTYCAEWVERYAKLGVASVRIFAGQPAKGVELETAIGWIAQNMKVALKHAAEHGVILAIENHDFTSDVQRLLEVIGKIDSPWAGVTLDTANLAKTADPYADLERIAPYAVTAQIKASIPVNGESVPADYGRVVKILQDAKFRGPVVLEFEEDNPRKNVPLELAKLREAIDF